MYAKYVHKHMQQIRSKLEDARGFTFVCFSVPAGYLKINSQEVLEKYAEIEHPRGSTEVPVCCQAHQVDPAVFPSESHAYRTFCHAFSGLNGWLRCPDMEIPHQRKAGCKKVQSFS